MKREKFLKFLNEWSGENYKRKLCIDESFVKDTNMAVGYIKNVLCALDSILKGDFKADLNLMKRIFDKDKCLLIPLDNPEINPLLLVEFQKTTDSKYGNYFGKWKFSIISLFISSFVNNNKLDFNDALRLLKDLILHNSFVFSTFLHEYYHFLFENNISGDMFNKLNSGVKMSEFNSYIKCLMYELIADNRKFFDSEEDLEKAYDNYKDPLETKYLLKQICNDDVYIKNILKEFNKEKSLLESSMNYLEEAYNFYLTHKDEETGYEIYSNDAKVLVDQYKDIINLFRKDWSLTDDKQRNE